MTSGSRQIRVACAKCDYDKQRTLAAGDDRTLEQLSASLPCGGCRTWGKSGALRVASVIPTVRVSSRSAHNRPSATRETAGIGGSHATSAHTANEASVQPRHVHGVCLNCGHNENFRPRWKRRDTLESLAREMVCPACEAEGAEGDIFLRQATGTKTNAELPKDIGASIPATLAWPFEILGLLVVVPLGLLWRLMAAFFRQLAHKLHGFWEPLLKMGALVVAAAAGAGVSYLVAIVMGAALSGPAELVIRAAEHEHRNAVHNSPRGGYLERVDRKYAETPRQMTYYNRRTVGED